MKLELHDTEIGKTEQGTSSNWPQIFKGALVTAFTLGAATLGGAVYYLAGRKSSETGISTESGNTKPFGDANVINTPPFGHPSTRGELFPFYEGVAGEA